MTQNLKKIILIYFNNKMYLDVFSPLSDHYVSIFSYYSNLLLYLQCLNVYDLETV